MPPPRKKQRQSLDASAAVPAPIKQDSAEVVTATPDSKDAKPAPPQRTLFIRSLPPTTTTESLTALFSQSRPIKHATAVLDPDTGKCRGYGFVTFADAEDALAAKDEFHNFKLNGELGEETANAPTEEENARLAKGRRLRVDLAEQRHRQKTSRFGADGLETDAADAATAKEKLAEEKKMKRDLEQGAKLIVRNLPWSIKSGEQLGKFFEKYGKLKGAVVPRKNGGLLQGFGFVTFKSRKAAEKALKEGSGFEIDGRAVAVDWAVTRDVWKGAPAADDEEEEDEVGIKTEDEDEGPDVNGDGEEVSEADLDDEDDEEDVENDEDVEEDEDEEDENEFEEEDRSGTLFIRNLPFTCTDEELEEAFRSFGPVRYARVVVDQVTERSRGTGFVCFYNVSDADQCLRDAPRQTQQKPADTKAPTTLSVLQDTTLDPTGRYTIDGRVVQVSRAVAKSEANRLTKEGVAARFSRDKDRRRLYLLSEGTISSKSALYERLSPTERQLREASAKQRRTLIESNPSLHLSLTRLSIRNVPRTVTSMDLKQLAREAVVGFAKDVKAGKRQRLSKEEVARGGEEMREAENARREQGKGIVKQAKIVFEGREGGKVEEKSGAGRSRGYGFIEYHTHRNALMGLRWLNGHQVDYQALQKVKEGKGKENQKEVLEDRKKRLIVEFAIENAQVVQRRKEREVKARDRGKGGDKEEAEGGKFGKKDKKGRPVKAGNKRKRNDDDEAKDEVADEKPDDDDKLAKRQRIIQKKRMMRRAKKQGKTWKS
ncbi:RNA-binding domain-containing protein [Myriangium duriaei CBS 260.36]|uniref:RNA-binding domain-containing protein n=1 Tax=Myriangium duriaei CBS 260.36 TaxID=1168546 RepID=A0A9P4MFX2_9PEZI|nr:RNA-binding domain-containing protein [Myriangium duriaei CBS 260.36]